MVDDTQLQWIDRPSAARAPRISEPIWTEYKAELIELHSSMSVEQISLYMRFRYNFKPTTRQYRYQFDKWGLRKYSTTGHTTRYTTGSSENLDGAPGCSQLRRCGDKRSLSTKSKESLIEYPGAGTSTELRCKKAKIGDHATDEQQHNEPMMFESCTRDYMTCAGPGPTQRSHSSFEVDTRHPQSSSSRSPDRNSSENKSKSTPSTVDPPTGATFLTVEFKDGSSTPPFDLHQSKMNVAPQHSIKPSHLEAARESSTIKRDGITQLLSVDSNRLAETYTESEIDRLIHAADFLFALYPKGDAFILCAIILKYLFSHRDGKDRSSTQTIPHDPAKPNGNYLQTIHDNYAAILEGSVQRRMKRKKAFYATLRYACCTDNQSQREIIYSLLQRMELETHTRGVDTFSSVESFLVKDVIVMQGLTQETMGLRSSVPARYSTKALLAGLSRDDRSLDLLTYCYLRLLNAPGNRTRYREFNIIERVPGPFEYGNSPGRDNQLGNPCLRSCISWCKEIIEDPSPLYETCSIEDNTILLFKKLWTKGFREPNASEPIWAGDTMKRMGISAVDLLTTVCRLITEHAANGFAHGVWALCATDDFTLAAKFLDALYALRYNKGIREREFNGVELVRELFDIEITTSSLAENRVSGSLWATSTGGDTLASIEDSFPYSRHLRTRNKKASIEDNFPYSEHLSTGNTVSSSHGSLDSMRRLAERIRRNMRHPTSESQVLPSSMIRGRGSSYSGASLLDFATLSSKISSLRISVTSSNNPPMSTGTD